MRFAHVFGFVALVVGVVSEPGIIPSNTADGKSLCFSNWDQDLAWPMNDAWNFNHLILHMAHCIKVMNKLSTFNLTAEEDRSHFHHCRSNLESMVSYMQSNSDFYKPLHRLCGTIRSVMRVGEEQHDHEHMIAMRKKRGTGDAFASIRDSAAQASYGGPVVARFNFPDAGAQANYQRQTRGVDNAFSGLRDAAAQASYGGPVVARFNFPDAGAQANYQRQTRGVGNAFSGLSDAAAQASYGGGLVNRVAGLRDAAAQASYGNLVNRFSFSDAAAEASYPPPPVVVAKRSIDGKMTSQKPEKQRKQHLIFDSLAQKASSQQELFDLLAGYNVGDIHIKEYRGETLTPAEQAHIDGWNRPEALQMASLGAYCTVSDISADPIADIADLVYKIIHQAPVIY